MLSCKEATRRVSEGLDRKLPFWRRMGLRLHVALCRRCSRYTCQVTALNRMISAHFGDDPPAEITEHVSQDAVQDIKSLLRQTTARTDGQDLEYGFRHTKRLTLSEGLERLRWRAERAGRRLRPAVLPYA